MPTQSDSPIEDVVQHLDRMEQDARKLLAMLTEDSLGKCRSLAMAWHVWAILDILERAKELTKAADVAMQGD